MPWVSKRFQHFAHVVHGQISLEVREMEEFKTGVLVGSIEKVLSMLDGPFVKKH